MDLKGLQWLGNVYNKFEAMCLEMEEAMYQDTVKYVENQVQTVNQNVKRFCAEVVKDFHQDSYVDPVKVAAADLSLNPYAHDMMQIASAKKEPRETHEKSVDDTRVLICGKVKSGVYKRPTARKKGHSSSDPCPFVYEPSSTVSGNLSSCSPISCGSGNHEVVPHKSDGILPSVRILEERHEAKEKILNPVIEAEGWPISHDSVDSPIAEANLSVEVVGPKESNLRRPSSIACSSSESAAEAECTISKVVCSTTQTQIADADTNPSQFVEEVLISQQERLDDGTGDTAHNRDVSDSDMEIIEQYNDSLLAETCILVEKENLQSLNQGDRTRKSYKKKLREAFSGKKGSTRKEYEQLASKSKDQDFNNVRLEGWLPASPSVEKLEISPSDTCPEPEWELV